MKPYLPFKASRNNSDTKQSCLLVFNKHQDKRNPRKGKIKTTNKRTQRHTISERTGLQQQYTVFFYQKKNREKLKRRKQKADTERKTRRWERHNAEGRLRRQRNVKEEQQKEKKDDKAAHTEK
jgi:hypothetical protein